MLIFRAFPATAHRFNVACPQGHVASNNVADNAYSLVFSANTSLRGAEVSCISGSAGSRIDDWRRRQNRQS